MQVMSTIIFEHRLSLLNCWLMSRWGETCCTEYAGGGERIKHKPSVIVMRNSAENHAHLCIQCIAAASCSTETIHWCHANIVRTSTSQHDTHYRASFGGPASYMRASTALHDIHSDMSLQSRITCTWCRFMWTNEPHIVSHWMCIIIWARAYTTHTMATLLRQFRTHQIKYQHIIKSHEPRLPNSKTTNTQASK